MENIGCKKIEGRFYTKISDCSEDIIFCVEKLNYSNINTIPLSTKVLLITNEQIACHGSTLRMIAENFNILPEIVYTNVSNDLLKIKNGSWLTIYTSLDIIKTDGQIFHLFPKLKTTNTELFGWQLDDKTVRCERPDRVYEKNTHDSIINGLIAFSEIINYNRKFSLFFDNYGRLWQKDFPNVKHIMDWIVKNPKIFISNSYEFIEFLVEILKNQDSINQELYLNNLLPKQFKYIRFFTSTASELKKLLQTSKTLDIKSYKTYLPLIDNEKSIKDKKNLISFSKNVTYYIDSVEKQILSDQKNLILYLATVCSLLSDFKRYSLSFLRENNKIYEMYKPRAWRIKKLNDDN